MRIDDTVSPNPRIFEAYIERWILDALHTGCASFAQLICVLPGVYPTLVLSTLRRMAHDEHRIPYWIYENALHEVVQSRASEILPSHAIPLPQPHPLDYDWRFTDDTTLRLIKHIETTTDHKDRVVLLGTPSVFRAIIEQKVQRNSILLDANTMVVDALANYSRKWQALQCDLSVDQLPHFKAQTVVLDPPWYEPAIHLFLWAAVAVGKQGTQIFAALPSVGTRPGMVGEWLRLLDWADALGLRLLRLEQETITYTSPPFECNALRASGLTNIPLNWRRGNLAIFLHDKRKTVPRPTLQSESTSPVWKEESLLGMRLHILEQKSPSVCDPRLITVIHGDILPSVSARDTRRSRATVWTSGNRIFDCNDRATLQVIVQSLGSHAPIKRAVVSHLGRDLTKEESYWVAHTVQQVRDVAKRELHEQGNVRIKKMESESRQMLWDTLQHATVGNPFWEPYLQQANERCGNVGLHLGVFVEPFLRYILDGHKTVESRFSSRRFAPYQAIQAGDIILLKQSSGPIVGLCQVTETWFYELDNDSWHGIRTNFSQALCAQDPAFWESRSNASFATLMRIRHVSSCPPIIFPKKDRRGWVVLQRGASTGIVTK